MLADMNVKIYTHLKIDIYGTAVTKLYSCRELLFQEFWIDYFRLDYEGLPPEVEVLVDLMRVEVDGEMAGSCRPLGSRGVLKARRPAHISIVISISIRIHYFL